LPAEPPTQDEIDAILMGADAIINQAGRSGLTLILNGSRSKKALEWEWDKLPDYGALQHLTADQITRKIDWCIHHKWLRLKHNRDGIPSTATSSSCCWRPSVSGAGVTWPQCCEPGFPTRCGRCGQPSTTPYKVLASGRCRILAAGQHRVRDKVVFKSNV